MNNETKRVVFEPTIATTNVIAGFVGLRYINGKNLTNTAYETKPAAAQRLFFII